ncbi:MAG: DNA-directed RNA polymerase subunit omega [Acutalibacteraceae bacterium]|nr:DNA-directed RNA polymerase subunit omega [Acutalibacteraceae bacterium]
MQMRRPSVDDMLQNKITRYSLVIAVAKRAREISAENSEMGIVVDEKPVLAAIKDFENHKYAILEPDVND